jgi:hypothetical protein
MADRTTTGKSFIGWIDTNVLERESARYGGDDRNSICRSRRIVQTGTQMSQLQVSIHRLCNLAAQLILPTGMHKRDSSNTLSAYCAYHLHTSPAHNSDMLMLYMKPAGMRPNTCFKRGDSQWPAASIYHVVWT